MTSVRSFLYFLVEDDLPSVYSEVLDLTPKWMAVGLMLGIRFTDLESISAAYHENPNKCLKEALALWLKRAYNTERNGLPTWNKMVEVAADPIAGENPALAATLARNHQGMQYTIRTSIILVMLLNMQDRHQMYGISL